MKITSVESILLSIPLRRPVWIAGRAIPGREYTLVKVNTDENVTGIGFVLGGVLVHQAVRDVLAPLLVGEDPFMAEALWQRMFDKTLLMGRRGAVLRGISILDIALWDLKGKALGLPLYRLLGGYRDSVPVYVSTAYYQENQTTDDVARDVASVVDRGFKAVKMRVGGATLKEDIARVTAARKAIGDDIDLMVDANFGYNEHHLGIQAGLAFQNLGVRWLEEPTQPDNLKGSAAIANALSMAVATGESESTRWAFLEIIEHGAADILQPDVTVVGGVSEWMKVAALASAHRMPLAPHYVWDVHVHLAAATPGVMIQEYFERESDLVNFDDVLRNPLVPVDGVLKAPEEPGLGAELDEESVQRFRIA